MLGEVKSEKSIYPLFCLLSCVITFFSGLLMVRRDWFPLYLVILLVVNIGFGYLPTIVKIVPAFLAVATVVGLLSLLFASPHQAFQTGYRVLLLGVSAVPTISMAPIDLVRVLNGLKCPRWLTLGLLIGLRFVGIMATEIRRIRQAMRLRGVNSAWYDPRVVYRAMVIPLMMRLLSISDLLALSLETRGFSMNGEVTSYRTILVGGRDGAYLAAITTVSLAGILLSGMGR